MLLNKIDLSLLLPLVLVFQTACGGGGSGSLFQDPGSANQNNTQLTGKIITSRTVGYQLWSMQLPGTALVQLPHRRWDEDDRYNNVARFEFAPKNYNNEGYILTVRACLPENSFSNCVVFLDSQGQVESSFTIPSDQIYGAKLSRDGKNVALIYRNYDNELWLQIYTANGEFLDESELPFKFQFPDLEWHPDGRIYLSADGGDKNIWVTYPNSARLNSSATLTLPDSYIGVVGKIAISPDGSAIALELTRDADASLGEAIPVVLSLDTLQLKRLIVDVHNANLDHVTVDEPAWSPDGRWILVEYGGDGGGVVIDNTPGQVVTGQGSTLPFLYAVPSDGVEVPLAPYNYNYQTSAVRILSDAIGGSGSPGDASYRADRWAGEQNYWVN